MDRRRVSPLIEGKHLGELKMLPARPGTCEECAVKHDPAHPHDAQSIFYQYRFYNEHGRWPNWLDAMGHCTLPMAALWCEKLEKMGVDVRAGEIIPKAQKK